MNFRISVQETGAAFEAGAQESLLDAATRQGVRLPHECTFGGCGTCRIRLLAGRVAYEEMPLALAPEEAEAGYALACQARACSDLAISVPQGPKVLPPQLHRAVVAGLHRRTNDIVSLQLDIATEALDYLPGQHLNVVLPDGGHRSFSMASPPAGKRVELHVRQVPGGRFTQGSLGSLQPGATMEVEMPHGAFRYHAEDERPIAMVATGTGIAPIKSMLEALLDDPDCPPVSLYWGMRTEADLYLAEHIAQWQDRLFEFRFVPVLSRAGASWGGVRGYVQDAVARDLPDLSEHAVYLCGSPNMIAAAKHRFLALGASADHLYADGFSFQHEATH